MVSRCGLKAFLSLIDLVAVVVGAVDSVDKSGKRRHRNECACL